MFERPLNIRYIKIVGIFVKEVAYEK